MKEWYYLYTVHENKVNKLFGCNSLNVILDPPKLSKTLNSHHYPILKGCMNILEGKEKFKNFRILLDSGCSSTIIIVRLINKLTPQKYSVMQWHTQAGKITTNSKVKIDSTLPELSTTKIVT